MRRLVLLPLVIVASACATTSDVADVPWREEELRFRAGAVDRSLPDVDAIGYEVDLVVDAVLGHETFRASVKGTYVATRALDEVSLDFEDNTIDEVQVSGRPAEHRREGGQLVVKLPSPVAAGATFSSRIGYHGALRRADGLDPNDFAAFGGFMVKERNRENERIFTTLSWPSKARRWLPLRDHPRDTAMIAIRATFPRSFTVLANGRRVAEQLHEDGSKTWSYEALTPMPTYDFHVSAYEGWAVDETRSTSGIPIATYSYGRTRARAQKVYADLPKALDFFEGTFGKYRWGSAAFIEEPIFGGGMEHASVVSMDETLFDDPEEARVTAFHELAHHWSGNAIHFRTWNDFWLSEGFTEYLTARAIEHLDGAEAARTIWRGYLTETLAADKSTPHPLAPPLDGGREIDVLAIFDAIPYQKGALTVRMLESIVGQAEMASFLRGWFERHGLGAAVTTDDLQRELEIATGRDLAGFFAGFVRESGHPELRATFTTTGRETTVTIEQLQERGPSGGFVFPLDLDLIDDEGGHERIKVELTGKVTTTTVTTARTTASILVDPDEYAVAVASCGQSGGRCRDGFRCAPQRAGISMCVPE